MIWIIGIITIYLGIGISLLVKGITKYGTPDGLTIFLMIMAWPRFFKEAL